MEGGKHFKKCAHRTLTRNEKKQLPWLKPGSPALVALEDVISNTRLLKNMEKLPEFHHTGALEVFHSLMLKYLPKRKHFTYSGVLARTQLAALDHNHNCSRAQAVVKSGTRKGQQRFKVEISLSLVDIFNCSFSTSTVPDKFKIASVIPVHKQSSKFILNNYRLISLLSIFSRILEKIVFKQLDSFIVKHNLLYENQSGFRSNYSTLHAVISITNKIQKAIDQGYYSCGIFLDLSKAFDTVNHQILLDKL